MPDHDPVDSPSHYTAGTLQCIDALLAAAGPEAHTDHCTQTAIAYLWRWRRKNGIEDLLKARWYITRAIDTQATMANNTHHTESNGPTDT
jgi:hypothetical protein